MNEYRDLTAEEFAEIAPVLEKCNIFSPDMVSRFVDTRLDKIYNVYLLKDGTKTILKNGGKANRDAMKYETYFAGHHFAVPRILSSFTVGEENFVRMEFAEGTDARGCTEEEGQRIGKALAQIQSHYLTSGGHTEKAGSYFTRCVFDRFQKIKEYYPDSEAVVSYVEHRFFEAPQTLIHDDLLPINVLLNAEALWFIDWEYAEILPYFLDLGRFAFVYDQSGDFFIPQESARAFLQSYYEKMQENSGFTISRKQFNLDTAVSAFCQYALFLSYNEDKDKLRTSADYRYLSGIIDYIKAEGLSSTQRSRIGGEDVPVFQTN